MSTSNKTLKRFLSKPRDFSYDELVRLLWSFGYKESTKGRTSGSRVAFISEEKHIICFHKPHGGESLKAYVLNYVEDELRKRGKL
jgi:hypothetical protein